MPADRPMLHGGASLQKYLEELQVKGDTSQDLAPLLQSTITAADASRVGPGFVEKLRAYTFTVAAVAGERSAFIAAAGPRGSWLVGLLNRAAAGQFASLNVGDYSLYFATMTPPRTNLPPGFSTGYQNANAAPAALVGTYNGAVGPVAAPAGVPVQNMVTNFTEQEWPNRRVGLFVPPGRGIAFYCNAINTNMVGEVTIRDA